MCVEDFFFSVFSSFFQFSDLVITEAFHSEKAHENENWFRFVDISNILIEKTVFHNVQIAKMVFCFPETSPDYVKGIKK